MVENLLQNYDNCLVLRIRMPISADLLHRNFVTKILNYAKVVNIPNSMTTLDDLIPIAIEAAQRKLTGVLNLCNPGAISHNEILQLYKDYIDPRFLSPSFSSLTHTLSHTHTLSLSLSLSLSPFSTHTLSHRSFFSSPTNRRIWHFCFSFTWTNFTEDECNAILKAQRSNNTLDHAKLVSLFPQVPEIHEACKQAFKKMKATVDAEGQEALTAKGWKFPTHHLKK